MKLRHIALTMAVITGTVFAGTQAQAAEKLVVGYQPYDTISYSAAVIRDK